MDATHTKKRKDGYNVKRIREILGVKQEDLAERMGVSQRSVSKIEATDEIKDEQLEEIAKALNVPVDAIKDYSDEVTYNFITNAYDNSTGNVVNCNYLTFNPVDKIIELYERMLQVEKDKVALLEEVLKDKK